MSYELLELFFARVNDFLQARPEETMEVTWHGGEPLLLGPAYYAKALEFQNKHCKNTAYRITHHVQTNLTLFNPSFVPVFKQLGIKSFGTSYDPYSDLRGIGETLDANLYRRKFIASARLAEREGFTWGMIYVVSRLSLERPLDIFWFLVNLNPSGSVMFNPIHLRNRTLSYLDITPEEYADFLGAIFPAWWKNRWRLRTVEPFRMMEDCLLKGSQALICCDAGDCSKTHFGLTPDGRFFQCGRSMEWDLLQLGSLQDRSFVEVLEDTQKLALRDRIDLLAKTECAGCEFWNVCHGGCPLEGWLTTGSLMSRTRLCQTKSRFIKKYFEPTVQGIALSGKAEESLESASCKDCATAAQSQESQPAVN
jgi:uncharacterized protein